MIGVRKLSPGGYEYLTGSVACADRDLDPGESLSDYYLAHGYPPGQWFGRSAAVLGMHGEVTAAQMNALFGEGRHPDADRIQAKMIAAGHTRAEAVTATKLGHRFYQYEGPDRVRSQVIEAYKQYNLDHDRPLNTPIDDTVRAAIRRDVQANAYADAHDGRQPTDADLGRWLAEQHKAMKSATSGYELVLAPPKSASTVFALDDTHRDLVVRLHRRAVLDTLTYLEDNVAFTRRGDGGHTQHDVTGITAAVFEHWDSRAGDPHLHTHVPISTKVQGPDGRWTALDGRTILAASVTMSEYYNSRIRDLFREHGAAWTERPAGGIDLKRPTWELDGVPDELLAGFSRRTAQVEQDRARRIAAFRRAHGREPTPKEVLEVSRRAQYGTRDAKQTPRSLAEHLRRWRAQAEEMVGSEVVEQLGQRVFGGEPEPLSEVDVAALAQATLTTVSDYYSHFNAWNIEAEAHRQSAHLRVADGGRDRLIGDVVQAVLGSDDIVALEAPSLVDEPDGLRRRSGESVFVEHNSRRFTTKRTLREESALAAWGRLTDGRRLRPATVDQALAKASKLNHGQRTAVSAFATSGRRVQLLYAPAGAGKTTTMKVYADAVRAEGGRVFAFGPSARAAQVLAEAINARPHTLHQVTTAQRMGVAEKGFPFRRGDVLIIDEVSMAGTHTLHEVVAYALRRGADVRLVGDDRQLAAVEAGGAVRWFEHLNGAVRLKEVVRFLDPDQRSASLTLHAGSAAGLDFYFAQGWVEGGSRESIRDAAHRAWRADLDAGRQSLLIVPTNSDVTALNLEARALRLARGDVDEEGRSAQLHDGTAASRGDWVVTRHNDRLKTLFGGRDFVKNGDTWDVLAVRRDGALKLRHQANHGTVVVPADYVAAHVELAYAATINRVQGMTSTGSAHAIATQGISREQLYTLITRAVDDNRIYVETHQHTIDSHQETPPELSARDVLEAALSRSSAETSANEELRNALVVAESLRTLVGRHDYVALLGTEEHIDAVLTEYVPALLDYPAAPALRQTLHTAQALGWQADHLVSAAMAGGLSEGGDGHRAVEGPAAVLRWRIQQRVLHEPPPARTAAPTLAATNRWRGLVERHDPTAAVEDTTWEPVWQVAAAALAEGLDVDAAIVDIARGLATRPTNDPMPEQRFALFALQDALRRQREQGGGWQPALPWLAHLDHHRLVEQPELLDYLHRVNDAIAARVGQLHATVAAEEPDWTGALGPRPDDPVVAARWDELAGLGAAYRDTYGVTTDDPRHPLGEEPQDDGLRARAWHDLIARWTPPTADESADTAQAATGVVQTSALDRLRDTIDLDELLAALAADELAASEPLEEGLSDLVRRYERGARAADGQHLDDRITQVLTTRAPSVLDGDAEPALRRLLHRAYDQGWAVEHVVPDSDSLASIDGARNPAAVLYRRIEQRLQRTDPPSEPARPRGPLPWLDAANPAALADQPELAQHLDQLAQAIADRASRLRDEIAVTQPGWTAGLGPRPDAPAAAVRWDDLAAAAAAYRETYRVTTRSPDIPLGAQPRGNDARARAWKNLTDQWRPIMTTPDDQFSANQERIDALRDQVLDHAESLQDDAVGSAENYGSDAHAAEVAEELHRYDDAEDIGESTDLSSGFGH
ncbi:MULTISPECIES: MobF family relaxase [Actinosynnema]|uniref:MobF family relaxase n=1 Tax=Actinosynnema TaxID=40566 RepID=UPI0020A37E83|nr:MobF family relaxase [Actinosynnema pretiosum]MCP2097500.1 conjugative relaxase domain-containing protein, TrwC/TraI family [Actinosynnema pretiosum]